MDRKLSRGNIKGKGDSGEIDLTGFLLKTGQGDQTSPMGWWSLRKLIKLSRVIGYAGWGVLANDLAGLLPKLDFTRKGIDGPRRRFRSLTKVWSSKASLSKDTPKFQSEKFKMGFKICL